MSCPSSLARVRSWYEHGNARERMRPAPSMGDVIEAPTRDHGAGFAAQLVEDFPAGRGEAVAGVAAGEHPLVQTLAAVPLRAGIAVAGPGDVPVQGHRHLDNHAAHLIPPSRRVC